LVEVPSFFNKIDFFGRLLPGYVVVTLFLILFRPPILDESSRQLLSTGIISFDLFSAIVFIVAGPAIGFTLTWLGRIFGYFWQRIRSVGRPIAKERINNYIKKYSELKVNLSEVDQARLDLTEAEYDFCASTCIGLAFIAIYSVYHSPELRLSLLLIIASSVILFIGTIYHKSQNYGPLLYSLFTKYNI
jgi:hypothetical protein